jgi:carboxymethylenebutenolidase
MCDEVTEKENNEFLKSSLSRREFNMLAAGAMVTMALPSVAGALSVTGEDVNVTTPDGVADCFFVRPEQGEHPGILLWPDIRGLRPAFRAMATRLAESGYSVLCVNPFYRTAKAPVVSEGESFGDPDVRARIMPYYQALSAETNVTDAKAFVTFLDAQSSVDTKRKIGTTGYCMGGPIVMRTAAALPGRIGAAGTFHGGGLVTDQQDSPHLLIPSMQAQFLIAVAENDDQREPETKNVLRESFDQEELHAEIEVYSGSMHGWCPPDSHVYNEAQAERAWSRMLTLFEKALA